MTTKISSPRVSSHPAPVPAEAAPFVSPPPGSAQQGASRPGKDQPRPVFERAIVQRALFDAVLKLDPRHQLKNPVMFVVEVASAFTLVLFFVALGGGLPERPGFILAISVWLWFTVSFANFAEAMAEQWGGYGAGEVAA